MAEELHEDFGDLRLDPGGNSTNPCEGKNRLAWILRQLAALVWPVLLGYSEAEPLVQNSHIDPPMGSHMKSYMSV